MNNVWHLMRDDLRRFRGNVVTIAIILGLVALPSIFSWYNIIACWDVFGNTGNLTVAVANSDEGYESDLVSMHVNIGDQITSALRANDQLNWVFTDEEDAIDGVKSGRYYAAVVIPSSFSRDMMSFYSSDMQHATITYYSNQKKSAIAPKVTDQGADQVAVQVNQAFAETISEVALGISSTVVDYLDDADADGNIGKLADHVKRLSGEMNAASSALGAYSTVLSSSKALVDESGNLISQARASANSLSGSVEGAREAAGSAASSLDQAKSTLDASIAQLEGGYASIPGSVQEAYSNADAAAAEAERLLREEAQIVAALGNEQGAADLNAAADAVAAANASTQASRAEAEALAAQAQADLQDAKNSYDADVKPALEDLETILSGAEGSLSSGIAAIDSASYGLQGTTEALSQKLGSSQEKLASAMSELEASSRKLNDMSTSITTALASGDLDTLRKIIGSDPAALASALSAPVQLERSAVYPVENFGSAMAPLYTTLALWIGALLIMVTLRVIPSEEAVSRLKNPTARQVFLGRFLSIAVLSLMQSTLLGVGNLLFLGVQAVNPFLYLVCFWVSGLVFAFIIYTFVSLFANLGKALSVVLLIVQVGGGGGSFPMQLLPQFFQDMSPFLPVAHAVNAMRAAMFGVYNNDFWIQIGQLLLFVVPVALLGLVLQKPLGKIVPRFVERVEQSKLM